MDYERFMECELVEWVNLMLSCNVFQSYSSIVTPNETIEQRKQKKANIDEGLNFVLI
jgi:hypothetical protein